MKQLFQLRRWLRAVCCLSSAFIGLAVATSTAPAQVTLVPPFVGDHSETWEEFGVSVIPDGTSILGGIAIITGSATITGTDMVTAKHFPMCSVVGTPSDGNILMDSDRPSGPLTISFSRPVSAFGAYWGSGLGCPNVAGFPDAPSILTFQDINGNVIGSDSFFYQGNGALMWRGYRFSTPVKTIIRTAGDGQEGVAMDGLQAIVAPTGPPLNLGNISTRGLVETGDQVMIGGFAVSGTDNKKVLLRAIGPSLSNPPFNLTGVLADPIIEVHDAHGIIGTNNNWKDTQQAEIAAIGLAPTNDLESAILLTLAPGSYTAIVRGNNGGTGTGLVEAYDIDPAANSTLSNISTRGFVNTGDNVMIGGFAIAGAGGSATVVVRAIGPSLLTRFGIQGALADPTLTLFDGNAMQIGFNDNWRDSQQAGIQATGFAPTNDLESAILMTLPSGNYTAIVRGNNNATGVGLVEVFNVQ
jgi:hypothetical protein